MNALRIKSGKDSIVLEFCGNPAVKEAVLFCHGFPGTNRLPGLREKLPSRCTLIELNYRGDKKSGGVFGFERAIDDVYHATLFVRKRLGARNVIPIGYSAGGLYVLNIANVHTDLFDSIVLVNPVTNAYLLTDAPCMGALWREARSIIRLAKREVYEKELMSFARRCNPVKFAPKIKNSVVLIQSEKDEVVPPSDSRLFFELLGCSKQYVVVKNAHHEVRGDEREIMRVFRRVPLLR